MHTIDKYTNYAVGPMIEIFNTKFDGKCLLKQSLAKISKANTEFGIVVSRLIISPRDITFH